MTLPDDASHADAPHGDSLAADLAMLLRVEGSRRQSLRWLLAGAATLPMLGCGGSSSSGSADAASSLAAAGGGSTTTTTTTPTGSCSVIPEETGGPYPADGTNSNGSGVVDVLTMSGIVRSDIRSSFGGATAVAAGVPLTIKLQLENVSSSCALLDGYAVYLWHCDRDGNYSLYANSVLTQNYLRGVQASGSDGTVTFTTIFPACYSGRMTHVHLEIYPSLAKATNAANRIKTTQFTFPMATLDEVYATSGYSASVTNLAQTSYATDLVFSDGTALEMASMSGNPTDGYVATLTVGVNGS